MQFAIPRGAPHAPAALAVIAAAILVGACSKGEPQSEKPRANAPLQIPQAKTEAPSTAGEVDAAVKERLARQEAASRLFEKAPAPPVATKPVERAPPAQPAPEPPKVVEAPPKVAVANPTPKVSAPPAPPPAASQPAPPPQSKAEPPAPARTEIAAAARPVPPPEPAAPRLITRVDPEFPREATQSGVDEGMVRARMTLDNGGNVTRVEVVEARPRRVFDRAVIRALSQWKYSEGPSGRLVEMEVAFRR